MKSLERPIVAQQQVIPHRAGNVQFTDCWVTSGSEAQAYSTSTEMLQRARLTAPLAHQVQESPVLLRQAGTNKQTLQRWMANKKRKRWFNTADGSPRKSQRTENPSSHRGGQMCTSSASPPEWLERGHSASASVERTGANQSANLTEFYWREFQNTTELQLHIIYSITCARDTFVMFGILIIILPDWVIYICPPTVVSTILTFFLSFSLKYRYFVHHIFLIVIDSGYDTWTGSCSICLPHPLIEPSCFLFLFSFVLYRFWHLWCPQLLTWPLFQLLNVAPLLIGGFSVNTL